MQYYATCRGDIVVPRKKSKFFKKSQSDKVSLSPLPDAPTLDNCIGWL